MKYAKALISSAIFSLCCYTAICDANNTPTHTLQKYQRDYFEPFNVQHALDVIEQLPGFALVENSGQRGLANTAGNVLIDGTPPLSKSESLSGILKKLSAELVEKVEVYNTGHPFSSVSHHSQVANIITRREHTTLNWQADTALRNQRNSFNELQLQLRAPTGQWIQQINLTAENSEFVSFTRADEFDARHQHIEVQTEDFIEKLKLFQIDTQSSIGSESDRLQITSKFISERWQTDFRHQYFQPLQTNAFDNETTIEWLDIDEYQLGADWQHTFSNGNTLQLLGFIKDNQQHRVDESLSKESADFSLENQQKEQVMQLSIQVFQWPLSPEFGLEISRNNLVATSHVNTRTYASKVSETRYQPFTAITWQLNPDWQLYARLNGERTELKTQRDKPTIFAQHHLKPLVKLSVNKNNWGVIWQFKRQVEQLDFSLFVASQDVTYGRVQLGNIDLKPEHYSELSMQLNYSYDDWLTLNTTFYHKWRKAIHEYVLLDNGEQEIGNAGDAQQFGVNTLLDLKTPWLLASSTLTLNHNYTNAHYNDTLGIQRTTNELVPHVFSAEFRHDLDTFSWGLEYTASEQSTEYYIDELIKENSAYSTSAYIEAQLHDTLQMRFSISSFADEKDNAWQQYFHSNRTNERNGHRIVTETTKPEFQMTLRGTFN